MCGVHAYHHYNLLEQVEHMKKYLTLIEGKMRWYENQIKIRGENSGLSQGRKDWEMSKKCIEKNLSKLLAQTGAEIE